MKQKLFIVVGMLLLIVTLIGLNAASYTQKPKVVDSEFDPNRSTFNSGPTGTQAYYSLLAETGRKVVRWQEPVDALSTSGKRSPSVFIVIGKTRREFTEVEALQLMRWVDEGGRLVLIDREPSTDLVKTSSHWKLEFSDPDLSKLISVDTSDQKQMSSGVAATKPGQPTVLSDSVNSIQPSVLTAGIKIKRMTEREIRDMTPRGNDDRPPPPSNTYKANKTEIKADPTSIVPAELSNAPVAHFTTDNENIVVDIPYGRGKIIYVADPFIVSNGGISMADNAKFAINLAASDGVIAFDEYHQGYGANNNRFIQFFAGTPVVAIFFQCLVLVGLIFYSQSRRFSRPVPEFEADRLSKLEYVSAMAELQYRTRSYDLAIENIYRDFRRRASRLFGFDNLAVNNRTLSSAIAERTTLDWGMVERTLDDCDQIIFGEPTNKREVLELTKRIREFEKALGLRRRPRG